MLGLRLGAKLGSRKRADGRVRLGWGQRWGRGGVGLREASLKTPKNDEHRVREQRLGMCRASLEGTGCRQAKAFRQQPLCLGLGGHAGRAGDPGEQQGTRRSVHSRPGQGAGLWPRWELWNYSETDSEPLRGGEERHCTHIYTHTGMDKYTKQGNHSSANTGLYLYPSFGERLSNKTDRNLETQYGTGSWA